MAAKKNIPMYIDNFFGMWYVSNIKGDVNGLFCSCRLFYSCGGFNTPTLCVEIKGIESDCNTL